MFSRFNDWIDIDMLVHFSLIKKRIDNVCLLNKVRWNNLYIFLLNLVSYGLDSAYSF